MSKGSTNLIISHGPVSGGYANCNCNSARGNCMSRDSNGGRQRPGQVLTHGRDHRERPLWTVSSSGHQRRWTSDGTSPVVVVVKKNRKQPRPPERRSSLCDPHSPSHSSFTCYSCPPVGTLILLGHSSSSSSCSSSSSSFSSTSSSCSSPPPIRTSAITGPDPLGWKLRLKTTSNPEGGTRVKAPRHRRSDPSAFLGSLHQLEELHAVRLRPVSHPGEFIDVFGDGNQEARKERCKKPPTVAEKTAMAKQIAQLIALSLQRPSDTFPKTGEENVDGRAMKPELTDVQAARSAELRVTRSYCSAPWQRNLSEDERA